MATQTPHANAPAQPRDRQTEESRSVPAARYDVGVFTRVMLASLVALAAARAISQAGMI